jgi:hypothetical protein
MNNYRSALAGADGTARRRVLSGKVYVYSVPSDRADGRIFNGTSPFFEGARRTAVPSPRRAVRVSSL